MTNLLFSVTSESVTPWSPCTFYNRETAEPEEAYVRANSCGLTWFPLAMNLIWFIFSYFYNNTSSQHSTLNKWLHSTPQRLWRWLTWLIYTALKHCTKNSIYYLLIDMLQQNFEKKRNLLGPFVSMVLNLRKHSETFVTFRSSFSRFMIISCSLVVS